MAFRALAVPLEPGEEVGAEVACDTCVALGQRLDVGVERNEYQFLPFLDPEARQAMGVLVDLGVALERDRQQSTIATVGPSVIRTRQALAVTGAFDQQCATMATHIRESDEPAVIGPTDDDRLRTEAHRIVVARVRDLLGEAGKDPVIVEDLLHLELVERLIGVAPKRQRYVVVDGLLKVGPA